MLGSIYFNNSIRKYTAAFGSVFSNLTLVRYNNDGTEQQRMVVPIANGNKEKFFQLLEGDPQGSRSVQIVLPRMSFIMQSCAYDPTRKQQQMIQNFALGTNGGVNTQYSAIPYNFQFDLYIYVRTIEDGNQIIEQIAPYFAPDYTLRVNVMPSMGIVKDVPIILDDMKVEVQNEGTEEADGTRMVVWTLSFTLRGWLFGPVSKAGIIKEAITNLYMENTDPTTQGFSSDHIQFVMANTAANGVITFGNYKIGEIVYQGNTITYARATAVVQNWSNSTGRLVITQVNGTFLTNTPVVGAESGADHTLINYEISPSPVEIITVTPKPSTANLGDQYTANVSISFPLG